MQIIDNKALLLRLKNPSHVVASVAKSKQVGDHEVLVKWDIDTAHTLRGLRVDVPSPIEGQYQWTGRFKPMDHQKSTASFLTMHRKAFCFSEQGTGKTASTIWAADFLLKKGAIRRVLVICPVSIMDVAWRADLFSFAMHRTVGIAHGSATKRKKVIAEGADFVIINYDGVGVVKDEIINGGFDLIIVDEATHYKNSQSLRWKTLSTIMRANPKTWLWMLTGTPAAQGPSDAYGLAKLVNPAGVPRTFSSFRDLVMRKITNFTWAPKPDSAKTVHAALQPAIRFSKDECLDLPDMVYVKRAVELTRQQKTYYEKLRKELLMEASGSTVSAANAAISMNKLLQISCGAVYDDDKNILEFNIKNRYRVLQEAIAEATKKVLVFVPYTHVIDLLREELTGDGYAVEVIRGDVPISRRTEIFQQFQQSGGPQILLIQPQAAAHGVTLTAADTVVWWGPTSSLETYAQANARVHRSGQSHKCTVVQLQGSPVERRLYALLDDRVTLHTQMISLYSDPLD